MQRDIVCVSDRKTLSSEITRESESRETWRVHVVGCGSHGCDGFAFNNAVGVSVLCNRDGGVVERRTEGRRGLPLTVLSSLRVGRFRCQERSEDAMVSRLSAR